MNRYVGYFYMSRYVFIYVHMCISIYKSIFILAMHSLTGASRPRLSETEPTWFVFETACYAFGGESVASQYK